MIKGPSRYLNNVAARSPRLGKEDRHGLLHILPWMSQKESKIYHTWFVNREFGRKHYTGNLKYFVILYREAVRGSGTYSTKGTELKLGM